MGRPTRAQQRRRQHSKDRIAKQAESGRQSCLFRSYSKQQPAPPLLKLTDARQQLGEAQQQLTALQQQLAEKEQQVAALQARMLELEH